MKSIELTSTSPSPSRLIATRAPRQGCRSARITLLSLLSLTGFAELASAADAATDAASEPTDSGGLVEIIVTAEK